MRNRRAQIILVVSVLVLVLAGFFATTRSAKTDEARCRDLIHTGRLHGRVLAMERSLPSQLVRLLHLVDLEAKYYKRYDAEQQALVASGYLVEVPLLVTNRPLLPEVNLLGKAFHRAGAFYSIRYASPNGVVVTCRPEDVIMCRKAVSDD
jgi:hypothetical protein